MMMRRQGARRTSGNARWLAHIRNDFIESIAARPLECRRLRRKPQRKVRGICIVVCVRGRRQGGMQAKGQRKEGTLRTPLTRWRRLDDPLSICNKTSYMESWRLCRALQAERPGIPRNPGCALLPPPLELRSSTAVPKREGSSSALRCFAVTVVFNQ